MWCNLFLCVKRFGKNIKSDNLFYSSVQRFRLSDSTPKQKYTVKMNEKLIYKKNKPEVKENKNLFSMKPYAFYFKNIHLSSRPN